MSVAAPFLLTVKVATSLDGRIALGNGQSRWITGARARAIGHQLRARHDAVVVGSGTVIQDDPLLTVRDVEQRPPRQPWRVVLDRRGRVSAHSRLVESAAPDQPVLVVTAQATLRTRAGLKVAVLEEQDIRKQLSAAASVVRPEDARQARLYLEGGGEVIAAAMRAGLVGRIEWFRAPVILGGDSRPAIGDLGLDALSEAARWCRVGLHRLGDDLWERWERQGNGPPCSPD